MIPNLKLGESDTVNAVVAMAEDKKLSELGEELWNGKVKCRRCGRWCASWLGLAIHVGKGHGPKRAARRPACARAMEPTARPLNYLDLKWVRGKRWW